jgi:PAS domain S-box-containing protein
MPELDATALPMNSTSSKTSSVLGSDLRPHPSSRLDAISLEQLHVLLDHLQGIVGYFDTQNRCVFANHAYAKAYDTTVAQMMGRHIKDIIGEKAWVVVEPHAKQVLSGEPVRYVREIEAGTQAAHWIDVHLVPNKLPTGETVGNFVFIEDITEQHRAAMTVRHTEERTQRFMQAGTEGVVFYRNGVIFDCNEAFTRLLGKTRESLIGSPAADLFAPEDRAFAREHMHKGLESIYPASLPRADGSRVLVEITGRSMEVDGQLASVATVRDTSQLAHINEALLRSQSRYRSMVENSDQIALFAADQQLGYANPAAVKFFNLSEEQLRGVPVMQFVHPEDRELARRRRDQIIGREKVKAEVVLRIISPPSESLAQHTVVRWVRLHGSLVEWDARQGLLVFMTDITTLRESEEKTRLALAQEKELGDLKTRFVAMASHEFRTPLATIQSSSELLQHYSDRLSNDERLEAVADIQTAVKRMQAMMESFLAFGRMGAGGIVFSPQPVAVKNLLRGLAQEMQAAHLRSHRFDYSTDASIRDDTVLMLDEVLMRQMVGNLLSNAAKYAKLGTRVSLSLARLEAAEGQSDKLLISVLDQGMGIPKEDLPRLFESFHRAGNVGTISGTGLGLAIVDRAARAHGGHVQVTSELGAGSMFSIRLPWVLPPKNS